MVRGGSGQAGAGLLGRVREVRELEGEVARLDATVARCRVRGTGVPKRRWRLRPTNSRTCATGTTRAALAVANHEKDLERSRERVKALGEAHEGRVVERSEILAESEALTEERERSSAGV